jgi:diacylglycerol O-acyltransferase / wax synthase
VRAAAGEGAPSGDGTFGNRISLMLVSLPTDEPDPVRRLEVANEATARAKDQHQALPADLLANAYQFAMPALLGLAMRANARLRVLERVGLFNVFVSNVPGPQVPLYVAGHQVVASFPVSAITDGQGLNITVLSYLGGLHVGITADRDLVPDAELLADHVVAELDGLVAGLRPRGRAAVTTKGTPRRPRARRGAGNGRRGAGDGRRE